MRKIIEDQYELNFNDSPHPKATLLVYLSKVLDDNQQLVELVQKDIAQGDSSKNVGRKGLTIDQILRIAIIYMITQLSYRELSFILSDSISYSNFCKLKSNRKYVSKSSLQGLVKQIKHTTLEAINKVIIEYAMKNNVDSLLKIRVDTTVVETNIHFPTDASLSKDFIKSISRLIGKVSTSIAVPFNKAFKNAKQLLNKINYTKDDNVLNELLMELFKLVNDTINSAILLKETLKEMWQKHIIDRIEPHNFIEDFNRLIILGNKILTQGVKRVAYKEHVQADEKVVSIYEDHTDIITKGNRDTQFGHKICLSVTNNSLICDCKILEGNPADATLSVDAVKRIIDMYKVTPQYIAMDGGFASKNNLSEIKELHVENMAFNKKRGLNIKDMTKSYLIYKMLTNFRAGIEGVISHLKRSFGLSRCKAKGLNNFKSHVQLAIVTCNLIIIAEYLSKIKKNE